MTLTSAQYVSALVLACALLLGMQLAFLPMPGVQQDEALFVFPYLNGHPSTYSWDIGKLSVPVMLMDYNGALKSWLYWPIFAFVGPSLWSVRLPVCLASIVILLVCADLVKRTCGPAIAAATALLLATDAPFLLTTVFDWGPVCLLILSTVAFLNLMQRFLVTGDSRFAAAASFVAGLACWDKAIFAFLLAAMIVAAWVLYSKEIRARISLRTFILAAVALGVGAFPLIAFNLHQAGATLKASEYLLRGLPSEKLLMLQRTLDGRALEHYMFRSVPGEDIALQGSSLEALVEGWYRTTNMRPGSFLFPAFLAALLGLPFLRNSRYFKPILFAWLSFGITVAAMLAFRAAGSGPHHTVLLYPAPQFLVAATAVGLAEQRHRWRPASALILLAVAASNLLLLAQYYKAGRNNGFSVYWSDGIAAVAQSLRASQKSAVFLDWGIQGGVQVELADRLEISADATPRAGTVYVSHCPSYVLEAERNAEHQQQVAASQVPVPSVRIVADKQGTPMFCLTELSPK
jgi:4-amino-4-deoxy-L-arabinose transferase-like glycosyltransferase